MSKCGYCGNELNSAVYKLGECQVCKKCYDLYKENYEFNNAYSKTDYWQMAKKLQKRLAELKAELEQDRQYIAQLEIDYEKANELGLEPSYIKNAIKENEQLKAENERLKKHNSYMREVEILNLDLQQQLKEKDEEIENIRKSLTRSDLVYKLLRANTKQVCEKIRKFIQDEKNSHIDYGIEYNCQYELEELLDKIEKGG